MTPDKPARLSLRAKDLLWHSGKALLCLAQLIAVTVAASESIRTLARANMDEGLQKPVYWLILFLTQASLFFFLWNYYDDIDDRAFDRFCEPDEPPSFFRDPAYLTGLLLSTAGGAGCLLVSLLPAARLLLPQLPRPVSLFLCVLLGLGTAGGLSVLRLRRRHSIWRVQKTLRRPTDKRPTLPRRILFAGIFFVVLLLLAVILTSIVPYLLHFLVSMLLISKGFLVAVLCLVAAWCGFRLLRRVRERHRFLERLCRLRDRRELSFTVHGHPYLSLFFHRAAFGLTIEDEPHPEARVKTPTTYRVAVADCRRRRLAVVLCEDNRFQFMHAFKLRILTNAHVPALGTVQPLSIPVAAFFTTHDFEFPEGEGEPILLVDPAPHQLCMHGFREGELIPLDNASAVYGYTVYSKNAFLRILERV